MKIERIGAARYDLGESPIWDPIGGALYFADSPNHTIHRLDPQSGALDQWRAPGRYLGSFALREGGGAVLAMDSGFHLFDFDSADCRLIAEPEAGKSDLRFNDGKVDARGRFIAGSMHRDFTAPAGSLYSLDAGHGWVKLDGGYYCSNGPCWSPDGKTFYIGDSDPGVIYAFDYDMASGAATNRREFYTASGSEPDGATVDAQGYIWSARFGGGCIHRIAPNGELDRVIDVPVAWVASLTFGGPDLDVLYVTSIGYEMGGMRDPSPASGGLFAIHGLGVTGLPEPRYKG